MPLGAQVAVATQSPLEESGSSAGHQRQGKTNAGRTNSDSPEHNSPEQSKPESPADSPNKQTKNDQTKQDERTKSSEKKPNDAETIKDAKKPPPSTKVVIGRAHHPWARFKPGAWRSHRIESEFLDERGEVKSISRTTSTQTLLEVTATEYAFREESSIEVQGKIFRSPPQTYRSGIYEQADLKSTKITNGGESTVTVEGRKLPCQVIKVVETGEKQISTAVLYFNPSVSPYVLRRETTVAEINGGQIPLVTTTEQVIALDMPFKVLTEIVLTSHIRTERKGPKGTIVTLSVHSDRVPGGVVTQWSKELDNDGRMIRRKLTELTDYGLRSPVTPRRRRRSDRRSEIEDEKQGLSESSFDAGRSMRWVDTRCAPAPRD